MSLKIKTLYLLMVTFISIIAPLSFPLLSFAETVTARLYQTAETKTFIDIKLTPPAPPTLIVEMKLPSGSNVIKTMPPFSKQNKKNNTIKWLLKNVKDTSFSIQLITQAKLDLGSTTVHIRYRNRDTGSLTEIEADRVSQ